MLKTRSKIKELRVRAPLEVCDWVKREAESYGVSLAAVVVDALEDHIKRMEAEKSAKRPSKTR
ncbi:hypothetical protein [Methylocystis echinoides]|uniref:Uncharacterized protein n=1 Tax=Methylocystis echinoides TaxID=29468 RepID=A0A9W6GW31_9HYPH|nr:hypothetical protein [Methylocystis echinoides]GLI93940.1 hypothetical protein LMG27198_29320 [Methylocystis echinoides]